MDHNNINSFVGIAGLSSLQSLYLWDNDLTEFDITGLSSIQNVTLATNQLTSFTHSGISPVRNLNLEHNQLTSFSGTGFPDLGMLLLDNNHIRLLSGLDDLTSLWFLTIANNCLVGEALDPSVSSWLTTNATNDDWTSQSATCPPVPPVCTEVTDVPATECEALMNIYTATSGDTWTNNTGWGINTVVNNWHGVTVADGHVTELRMRTNNMQ